MFIKLLILAVSVATCKTTQSEDHLSVQELPGTSFQQYEVILESPEIFFKTSQRHMYFILDMDKRYIISGNIAAFSGDVEKFGQQKFTDFLQNKIHPPYCALETYPEGEKYPNQIVLRLTTLIVEDGKGMVVFYIYKDKNAKRYTGIGKLDCNGIPLNQDGKLTIAFLNSFIPKEFIKEIKQTDSFVEN